MAIGRIFLLICALVCFVLDALSIPAGVKWFSLGCAFVVGAFIL